MKRYAVALLLVALLGACGGGSDDPAASPSATTGGPRPTSTGILAFLSPTPGQAVARGNVRVRLSLTGATIAEKVEPATRGDIGHVHLRLDGKTVTLLAGLDVVLNDLPDVEITPGTHILEAEFAASDHGPFDPRVIVQTTFRAS